MNDRFGGPVNSPEDLRDLEAILNGLVDLPLLAVRTAYGRELRLDFGQSVPFRSPLLAGRVRGEWVLGTRASPWCVFRSNEFAAGAQHPQDRNETALAELVGATVTNARVSYPDLDLTLSFDGGAAFTVSVDRGEIDNHDNDHDENDLSAWELFTPDRLVLTVGPGRRWSLTPVDSPTDATS